MVGEPAAYSGTENLEVMAEAKNYNRYLMSLIAAQLRPGDNVLDFGAGVGTFAAELHGDGVRLVAVEPDPALSRRLSERGIPTHRSAAPVAGASMDLVYTLNVLEHIADDDAAAKDIARVLKSGGRLIAYVPAFNVLWTAMDDRVGHIRRYRRRGLVALLRAAGFRITYVLAVPGLADFARGERHFETGELVSFTSALVAAGCGTVVHSEVMTAPRSRTVPSFYSNSVSSDVVRIDAANCHL